MVHADVADAGQLGCAFNRHLEHFGSLQYVVLNAGISEQGSFLVQDNNGWEKTVAVNLVAVASGCRLAARAMTEQGGERADVLQLPMLLHSGPAYSNSNASDTCV